MRGSIVIIFIAAIFAGVGLHLYRNMSTQTTQQQQEITARAIERAILEHVAERNPGATFATFKNFPVTLLREAEKSNIDHCLLLAQAEVESEFRPAAVGRAGEIGLFQILPSTAKIFEVQVPFKKPSGRELGDLANPVINTKIASAYLRDIMTRRSTMKEVLTEYNGGPLGRHPHYYRMVVGTYMEILENTDLSCRYRAADPPKIAAEMTGASINGLLAGWRP